MDFRLFFFIFIGCSLFAFILGTINGSNMSVEERILAGEITGAYDRKSEKFEILYSCGDFRNFIKFGINGDGAIDALNVPPNSTAWKIIEENQKELISATGITLGIKYADLIKIGVISVKELKGDPRKIIAGVLGALSGYVLGTEISKHFSLHCRSASNTDWILLQDRQRILFYLYLGYAKQELACLKELEPNLTIHAFLARSSRNVVVPQTFDSLLRTSGMLNSATFLGRSSELKHYVQDKTYDNDDFQLVLNAMDECVSRQAVIQTQNSHLIELRINSLRLGPQ